MKKLFTVSILLIVTAVLSVPSALSQSGSRESERERKREREIIEGRKAEVLSKREAEARTEYYFQSKAPSGGTYVVSGGDGFVFDISDGSQSSQLSLSKRFDGESVENEGTFEVDDQVSQISINLGGAVKEGKITLKIKLPNKEDLKEMTIDNTADVQFNQMIRITGEDSKYTGKWTYEIKAVKAVGNYRLTIHTH